MKKVLIVALVIFSFTATKAQIGGALKNKINQKANEALDKSIDKATQKKDKENKEKEEEQTETENGNNNETSSSSTSKKEDLISYSKYDFVSGDKIIFEDNVVGETAGEFPSKWNLVSGNIEIAEINEENVIAFIDGNYAAISPFMSREDDYLPEVFTVQFDAYFKDSEQLYFKFYDEGKQDYMQTNDMHDWYNIGGVNHVLQANSYHPDRDNIPGKWHPVAMSFNKGDIKIYVDQYRVINIPRAQGNPIGLTIGSYSLDGSQLFIKNFRIAEGGKDLYSRISTEGKIVTRGILFDIGKSSIKPVSMGTLNEIVKVMKKDPSLKFSIEGHTDSDGDEAANLKLSKERAEAVKAELVKLGIDASRLSTKGLGESKPVDKAETPEGKANNRRVEFVKM